MLSSLCVSPVGLRGFFIYDEKDRSAGVGKENLRLRSEYPAVV